MRLNLGFCGPEERQVALFKSLAIGPRLPPAGVVVVMADAFRLECTCQIILRIELHVLRQVGHLVPDVSRFMGEQMQGLFFSPDPDGDGVNAIFGRIRIPDYFDLNYRGVNK